VPQVARREVVERAARRRGPDVIRAVREPVRADAAARIAPGSHGGDQLDERHLALAGDHDVEAGDQRRCGLGGRVHAAGDVEGLAGVGAQPGKIVRGPRGIRRVERPRDDDGTARRGDRACDLVAAVCEHDLDRARAVVGVERRGDDVERRDAGAHGIRDHDHGRRSVPSSNARCANASTTSA
jgi:hypothetical protein